MINHTVLVVVATLVLLLCLTAGSLARFRENFTAAPKTYRFSTTKKPYGVAFSKDNKYVFVNGDVLSVYKILPGLKTEFVKNVTFAGATKGFGVSLSPDGSKLVVGRSDQLVFLSTPALAIPSGQAFLASVTIPSKGKEAATTLEPTFSPDGTRVVCPIEYNYRAVVVDVNLALANRGSGAIVGYIPSGSATVGVSFYPPGQPDLVAITSESDKTAKRPGSQCSGSVRVSNFRTMKPVKTIPVGCEAVRVAIGDNDIFVTSRADNKVIVVNRGNSDKQTEIPTGPNPVGIKLVPNSPYLIVAASNRYGNGNGEINVINTTTSKVVTRIPGLKFPRSVAVSSDGALAAVTYFNSDAVELLNIPALAN